MIHFYIHDTLLFIKIHDISFLISNLSCHKIINKTFDFFTLQSHIKHNVFNSNLT